VVTHGDATFDNILIDANGRVGFIDCGRAGRADRYVDLSLLALQIDEHLGARWISQFREAYGIARRDHCKAAFFDDLYELF
jgi:aminoglycoside 3'-phosphotransferase II